MKMTVHVLVFQPLASSSNKFEEGSPEAQSTTTTAAMDFIENDIVQSSLPESDNENDPMNVTVFQAIQSSIASNFSCEVSDSDD